ncbi:MAG: 5'/3'-nucleotidase SurE [Chromatiales bacterium]|nr:5'/3'-nucleotidase SurE [Gammaproteobacteria bacterium]MCP5351615.1 5'/3'-nucleotidase SurE [Chromatiales bacterium]
MHILLSNDDGYYAPGLLALRDALQALGTVTVVAPDRDRSGASNSLTLDAPIRVVEMPDGILRTSGTPTDCVHVAITGLLDAEPDIVVSGINSGPNMGDDVMYSGTVAAAMEGRHLGLPAIAVSLASYTPEHYETAAEIVRRLVERLRDHPMPAESILNVNVPDVPLSEIRGVRATRLGNRHKAEPAVPTLNPRGLNMFWIGPAGPEQDAGEGTDFHAVRENYVSVTPIHVDLTRHAALASTGAWLAEAKLA